MSDNTIQLTPPLYLYLLENSLHEPPILQALREQTHKMSMSRMQISPEQGQFMRWLVKVMGATKALEVGVFTGYSALSVALVLPENGQLIACDVNPEWTKIAQKYWAKADVDHKITLKLAPAVETLQGLIQAGEANTFDFAFIDADKKNYPIYYELVLELLRPGGVLAIDNVLWSGRVADPLNQEDNTNIIRELNAKIYQDKRVILSMIPIGDGLSLIRKN